MTKKWECQDHGRRKVLDAETGLLICLDCKAIRIARTVRSARIQAEGRLCSVCREREGMNLVGNAPRARACDPCLKILRARVRKYFSGAGTVRRMVFSEGINGLMAVQIARGEIR